MRTIAWSAWLVKPSCPAAAVLLERPSISFYLQWRGFPELSSKRLLLSTSSWHLLLSCYGTHIIEILMNIIGYRSASEQGRPRTRDGTYTRKAYMPVSHFNVGAIFANSSLSPAQPEKRIKGAVMRKLPYVVNARGEKVVHEESQEN